MPNPNPPSGKSDNGKEGEEGKKQPYDVEPAAHDDDVPTERAIVKFGLEPLGLSTEVDLPGRHAGGLLEVLRWAIGAVLAVAGPALTLNTVPEQFPAWMTFTVVLIQLAVTVYVVWMFDRGGKSRR